MGLGLTLRQAKVYARWYCGDTHEQIAVAFGMRRSRVTEMLARARAKAPRLPKKRPFTGNSRSVRQLSQVAVEQF